MNQLTRIYLNLLSIELPRSPNNITPKKLLYIYRSYKKSLILYSLLISICCLLQATTPI
ncbi:hypothetical protein E4K44_08640 [Neisseria meningitidis]|nr:hypothetical protein [Neisseria meningitidis]